jgi:hypothetical protein
MDEQEEDWLEHLNVMKSRGKGAPKKKRTAAGKIYPDLVDIAGRFTDFLQNRRNSTRGDDERLWSRRLEMSGNACRHCISCTSHSIPEGVWEIHHVCIHCMDLEIGRSCYADTVQRHHLLGTSQSVSTGLQCRKI